MMIIDYKKKYHKQIIRSCVEALRKGKVVAYPTDTCYGLAVDATNARAIKKLYRVKERSARQPMHIVVPSVIYAKKIVKWNKISSRLAKRFWPGPLTIVLALKAKGQGLKLLSAGTGTLGIRRPKNNIALDLAKYLKKPITTTSANPPNSLGGHDSYSADDIVEQFKGKKFRPGIIINAGKLPKRKPSALIKVNQDQSIQILRQGPVSETKIRKILNFKS
ncbi:MAG: L-threonylcarbamoyladenylate synthase [Candidatus Doudnabacteria bacterium]|nr:L-threonylcarbamoyladenylate synthase [Candidatus Doudnabacteria bacterium]